VSSSAYHQVIPLSFLIYPLNHKPIQKLWDFILRMVCI
jgi:hypothetical protein